MQGKEAKREQPEAETEDEEAGSDDSDEWSFSSSEDSEDDLSSSEGDSPDGWSAGKRWGRAKPKDGDIIVDKKNAHSCEDLRLLLWSHMQSNMAMQEQSTEQGKILKVYKAVQKQPILEHLPDEVVYNISRRTKLKEMAAGGKLCTEGEPASAFSILLRGEVNVSWEGMTLRAIQKKKMKRSTSVESRPRNSAPDKEKFVAPGEEGGVSSRANSFTRSISEKRQTVAVMESTKEPGGNGKVRVTWTPRKSKWDILAHVAAATAELGSNTEEKRRGNRQSRISVLQNRKMEKLKTTLEEKQKEAEKAKGLGGLVGVIEEEEEEEEPAGSLASLKFTKEAPPKAAASARASRRSEFVPSRKPDDDRAASLDAPGPLGMGKRQSRKQRDSYAGRGTILGKIGEDSVSKGRNFIKATANARLLATSANDKPHVKHSVGAVIGFGALLSGERFMATVVCNTDCEFARISRQSYLAAIRKFAAKKCLQVMPLWAEQLPEEVQNLLWTAMHHRHLVPGEMLSNSFFQGGSGAGSPRTGTDKSGATPERDAFMFLLYGELKVAFKHRPQQRVQAVAKAARSSEKYSPRRSTRDALRETVRRISKAAGASTPKTSPQRASMLKKSNSSGASSNMAEAAALAMAEMEQEKLPQQPALTRRKSFLDSSRIRAQEAAADEGGGVTELSQGLQVKTGSPEAEVDPDMVAEVELYAGWFGHEHLAGSVFQELQRSFRATGLQALGPQDFRWDRVEAEETSEVLFIDRLTVNILMEYQQEARRRSQKRAATGEQHSGDFITPAILKLAMACPQHARTPLHLHILMRHMEEVEEIMPVEGRREICVHGRHLYLRKGATVIQQGAEAEEFYFIMQGTAKVVKKVESKASHVGTDKESQQVLRHYSAGQMFGELALLTTDRRAASVVCTSDCDLFVIDKSHFYRMRKTVDMIRVGSMASLLSQAGIFSMAPPPLLMKLAAAAHTQDLPRGIEVIRQGHPVSSVCIITKGECLMTVQVPEGDGDGDKDAKVKEEKSETEKKAAKHWGAAGQTVVTGVRIHGKPTSSEEFKYSAEVKSMPLTGRRAMRTVQVAVLAKGDSFGEQQALRGGASEVTVTTATSPCSLIMINVAKFRSCLNLFTRTHDSVVRSVEERSRVHLERIRGSRRIVCTKQLHELEQQLRPPDQPRPAADKAKDKSPAPPSKISISNNYKMLAQVEERHSKQRELLASQAGTTCMVDDSGQPEEPSPGPSSSRPLSGTTATPRPPSSRLSASFPSARPVSGRPSSSRTAASTSGLSAELSWTRLSSMSEVSAVELGGTGGAGLEGLGHSQEHVFVDPMMLAPTHGRVGYQVAVLSPIPPEEPELAEVIKSRLVEIGKWEHIEHVHPTITHGAFSLYKDDPPIHLQATPPLKPKTPSNPASSAPPVPTPRAPPSPLRAPASPPPALPSPLRAPASPPRASPSPLRAPASPPHASPSPPRGPASPPRGPASPPRAPTAPTPTSPTSPKVAVPPLALHEVRDEHRTGLEDPGPHAGPAPPPAPAPPTAPARLTLRPAPPPPVPGHPTAATGAAVLAPLPPGEGSGRRLAARAAPNQARSHRLSQEPQVPRSGALSSEHGSGGGVARSSKALAGSRSAREAGAPEARLPYPGLFPLRHLITDSPTNEWDGDSVWAHMYDPPPQSLMKEMEAYQRGHNVLPRIGDGSIRKVLRETSRVPLRVEPFKLRMMAGAAMEIQVGAGAPGKGKVSAIQPNKAQLPEDSVAQKSTKQQDCCPPPPRRHSDHLPRVPTASKRPGGERNAGMGSRGGATEHSGSKTDRTGLSGVKNGRIEKASTRGSSTARETTSQRGGSPERMRTSLSSIRGFDSRSLIGFDNGIVSDGVWYY